MPVEAKPLFRPDGLPSHLSGFTMPAVDTTKLRDWSIEISTRCVDRFGEQEILPHFLNNVFVGILSYREPAGQEFASFGHSLRRETVNPAAAQDAHCAGAARLDPEGVKDQGDASGERFRFWGAIPLSEVIENDLKLSIQNLHLPYSLKELPI